LKDTGDAGKGTAKALLEKIADLEEDAQRSLMHRSGTKISIII
jgi:alpha-glucan, water dikinase